MDTVLIHNAHKITSSDTISAVVSNIPERINLSEDVMGVYDSLQNQLVLSNTKIDSLYAFLQARETDGWGINQIMALVAIPLVIAVFAFTLPLVFNAIAKIERLYQCPEITAKLSSSWQLWMYFISVGLGLLTICVLPFFRISHAVEILLVLLLLVIILSVFAFYYVVNRFSDPYWVLNKLRDWFKSESTKMQKKQNSSLKKIVRYYYRHMNDKDNRRILTSVVNLRKAYLYMNDNVDRLFYRRIYALIKIAVSTKNLPLYIAAISEQKNQVRFEKMESLKRQDASLKEVNYSEGLFEFYENTLALVGQEKDPKYREYVMYSLNETFDQGQLPYLRYIVSILRALRIQQSKYGVHTLQRYLNQANRLYSGVRVIPQIAYVTGCGVEDKKKVETAYRENWNYLCNLHYMFGAYWWNEQEYALLSTLCPERDTPQYMNFYPASFAEVFYRYVKVSYAIKKADLSYWFTTEVFDMKPEQMLTIVSEYTLFLLYYTATRSKLYFEVELSKDMVNHIDEALFELLSVHRKGNVEKICRSVGINAADIDIRRLLDIAAAELNINYQENTTQASVNQKIVDKLSAQFEDMQAILQETVDEPIYNIAPISGTDEISLNICSVAVDKLFFTNQEIDNYAEYRMTREIGQIIANRYLYVWLSCINQMKINEITSDMVKLKENVLRLSKGKLDEYVIIGIDFQYDSFLSKKDTNLPYYSIRVDRFELFKKTRIYLENENKLYMIRKEDLPSVQYIANCNKATCTINEEMSTDSCILLERMNIDPHMVLKYNRNARIFRIIPQKQSIR